MRGVLLGLALALGLVFGGAGSVGVWGAGVPAALAAQAAAPPVLEAEPVAWYEAGARKTAWMATDELLVLDGGDGAEQAARRLGSRFRVAGREGGVAVLKTAGRMDRQAVRERLADLRRSSPGRQASPAFYAMRDGRAESRMALSGDVVVRFAPDADQAEIARLEAELGLTRVRAFDSAPGAYLYRAEDALASLDAANALAGRDRVLYAYPAWRKRMARRFTPDDTYYPNQWHLANTGGNSGGTAGIDLRVTSVWDTYKGEGQVIGVLDPGGVQMTHEDLAVDPALSWNFTTGTNDTTDATPDSYGDPGDAHGTACAGLAAAAGNNAKGVAGVAMRATVAAVTLGDYLVDSVIHDGLLWKSNVIGVSTNSWGPEDYPHLEGPGPLALDALAAAASTGRAGRGVVITWANGNGATSGDSSEYDGFASSRYVIPVAAVGPDGKRVYYSERGANILVCGLVGSPSSSHQIWTTTHTGSGDSGTANYTGLFSGTSATSPQVAGVAALMLQANPALTWRDVQQILARTARQIDGSDSDWQVNGAGWHVNHKYGFGLVDAQAAVAAAAAWTSVGQESTSVAGAAPGAAIPDNDATGVSNAVEVLDDLAVDFVDVVFSAPDHPRWGDLEVVLTGPSGISSILAQQHPDEEETPYDLWRFGTRRHFGESSRGTWTLTVRDRASGQTGTFSYWGLKFYGTPVSLQAPQAGFASDVRSVSASTSRAGGTVRFFDTSRGQIASWLWNFGDGTTSSLQNPTHTYASQGSYTVTLSVTDASSRSAASTQAGYITVAPATVVSTGSTSGSGGSGGGGGGGCVALPPGAGQPPAGADWLLVAVGAALPLLRRIRK